VAGIGAPAARTLSDSDAVRPSGDEAVTTYVPGVDGDGTTSVALPAALAVAVPSVEPGIAKVTTAPATNPVAVNVTDDPTLVVGVGVVNNGVVGG
jgi:hypothetical protein